MAADFRPLRTTTQRGRLRRAAHLPRATNEDVPGSRDPPMERAGTANERRARAAASVTRTVAGSVTSFVRRINEAADEYASDVFLTRVSSGLLDVTGCDAVELVVRRRNDVERCERTRDSEGEPTLRRFSVDDAGSAGDTALGGCERALAHLLHPQDEPVKSLLWQAGSGWAALDGSPAGHRVPSELSHCLSLRNTTLLLAFALNEGDRALVLLKYGEREPLNAHEVRFLEAIVHMLRLILENRPVTASLVERVKELECLHAIARIRAERTTSTDEQLRRIVQTLPAAWRHPEWMGARIEIDGKEFTTRAREEGAPCLAADIEVRGESRGVVEVFYDSGGSGEGLAEPLFLDEERRLLETIAKELTLMFERKLAEAEESKVVSQLRHADRLATIGQLSAGVAHEINEPLSSILGFAQLIGREPGLSEQMRRDLQKIEKAALRGREIVQNLLLFARQTPGPERPVDLNRVVEDALSLVQPRLAKYELELALEPTLPSIVGDSMSLSQVVVNLVTNAVQAMPRGGRLTLRTLEESADVCLVVEDTGGGMNDEIAEEIFMPFFTTKDVGEGTGLGLSVVHGIVTSHGGSITMRSKEGIGTRFEVRFPVRRETSD